MGRYGVIDLGSNTIRLVVFQVEESSGGARPWRSFEALVDESQVAGLSAYVREGSLAAAGVERAVAALRDELALARKLGCARTQVFATAVLRNCSNREEAVAAIEERIGCAVDVLSGEEEARLGFVGATLDEPIEEGVLVDIGGGSTELTAIEAGRDALSLSIPQGCVSAYAQFVSMILPEPEEVRTIREAFKAHLEAAGVARSLKAETLYGIGGGVRAAAKMRCAMAGAGAAADSLGVAEVDEVLALLAADRSAFAHLAVKAAPDRLHALVPGCVMLRSLMGALGARTMRFCRYGLREGYLVERMLG